jgi:hypothetical protein
MVSFDHLPHGLMSMSIKKWFPARIYFQEVSKDIYFALNDIN